MFVENVHKHPEWKRLAEEIQPLLETCRVFSYELLKALAGIDIQSQRGRQQFERFRKHALDEWGLWFECDPKQGYHIADVAETPGVSVRKMKRAKRQNTKALAIVVKTRDNGATTSVIKARQQLAASLGALLLATENEAKKVRPCLRQITPGKDKSDARVQLARFEHIAEQGK